MFENIAFDSRKPVDKIVRIITGSYTTADEFTRTGGIFNPKLVKVGHGLNRPVLVDMQYSVDGGVTWKEPNTEIGTTVYTMAFSDDLYVYMFSIASTYPTVHYRLYCHWIDDYDNTKPWVETINYSTEPIHFDSRENYQKIYDFNTKIFTASVGTETLSVAHDLGYMPNAKAWFQSVTGEVWQLHAGGASNPFLYDFTQDEMDMSIYSDRVDLRLYNYSGTARKAWYKIYYDQS